MKKLIFVLPIILLVAISCGKTSTSGCTPATVASEQAAMVAYCTTYSINYTIHSSGILYQIINPGTGNTPSLSDSIIITYKGKFLDDRVFDSLNAPLAAGWPLNSLIDGWKIGLPLIKKGGHIKLVIPSSLAYGCSGYGTIPPNTPLFFDINLIDFHK